MVIDPTRFKKRNGHVNLHKGLEIFNKSALPWRIKSAFTTKASFS